MYSLSFSTQYVAERQSVQPRGFGWNYLSSATISWYYDDETVVLVMVTRLHCDHMQTG